MSRIRRLNLSADLDRVERFYLEAPEYWETLEGHPPGRQKAQEFFEAVPPGCDPAKAVHLGLFETGRLSGIADLSFGFPGEDDAYIGLMLLAPRARSRGRGPILLRQLEAVAHAGGGVRLCLAVTADNRKGRAFWEREGFSATGLSGERTFGTNRFTLHRLQKMVSSA